MPKAFSEWKVLAHGPIERLAENLWWVQGALLGMSLKRVMTIARLNDGRLVIHNAIALAEPAMREIEAWGTPAFLVVPSPRHRLDAPAYSAIPRCVCSHRAAHAVPSSKCWQWTAATKTSAPMTACAWEPLRGVNDVEGVMFVRSSDGVSIVLNDSLFNMDRKRDALGFLFTTLMGSAPGPRVSRLAKLLLVKDKSALNKSSHASWNCPMCSA